MTEITFTIACPNCGAGMSKMPQRKSKCNACGKLIFINSTPENRVKRLMTELQSNDADQAWSEKAALDGLASHAAPLGISAAAVESAFYQHGKNPDLTANTLFSTAAIAGSRQAILTLASFYGDRKTRRQWRLLLAALDLKELQNKGIRFAQIFSLGDSQCLCATCKKQDGKVIPTTASALELLPPDCACEQLGMLSVSGHIKQADERERVDRLGVYQ